MKKVRLTIPFLLMLSLTACAGRLGEADRNFARGNRFLSDGLPQMAIQAYQRSLSADPDQPEAWFNLGVAQLGVGQPEAAAQAFQRTLQLKPSARAWHNLGYAELRADRPAEAAKALNRSVELDPNQASAWNNLAVSYRRLGRFHLAEEASQKALSLAPDDPQILNNLAWLYLVWNGAGPDRRKKALELAKKAETQSQGKDPRILATLAEAYFKNNDRESAIRSIERALLHEPKNRHFQNKLATYRGEKTN